MNVDHTKILLPAAKQLQNVNVINLELLGTRIMQQSCSSTFKESIFTQSFVSTAYALYFKQYVIGACEKHGINEKAKILPPIILRSNDDVVLRLSSKVVVIMHHNGPIIPVVDGDMSDKHTAMIIRRIYGVDDSVYINRDNFAGLF